ncbi:hypothetical protein PTSG_03106 [Salpingoeca rosetta]|uniref:Rho-GAP domain-containing protein n=1 Tax=Salpingoeca rosetta (strain ATCC 50818 / BSB-021) TaxID=946362 RepID=F2U490_SALR5|nr:uncharacterized protein PTSG_03106 [Salpingoeca rosetta]EGD82456.1 hypothetical protein PTSG_03106 [Salpingoeca rosetta]|eukprot:XP_004995692.1 hypothetical protein PTSG_03106 [Salpingoeca rosetta]
MLRLASDQKATKKRGMAEGKKRLQGLKNKLWGLSRSSTDFQAPGGLRGELSVTIIAADGLPTSSGSSSPYDPYCVVHIVSPGGGRSKGFKTGVRKRTASPQWHEDLDLPDVESGEALELSVRHWSRLGKTKTIARAVVDMHTLIDGEAHYMTLELSPKGRLHLCITFLDMSSLFGLPIEDVCRREGRSIPKIVTRCVKEIEERGLEELGLYRVAGNARILRHLKEQFNDDPQTACLDGDAVPNVSTVASLLKAYLRELPEPLFTSDLYPMFMEAAGKQVTHAARLRFLQGTIMALPKANYDTAVYLLDHWTHVLSFSGANKMTSPSLATCLGPSLFTPAETDERAMEAYSVERQNAVTQYLLDHWAELRQELTPPDIPPEDCIDVFLKSPPRLPVPTITHDTDGTDLEGPLISPTEELSRKALELRQSHGGDVASVLEFMGIDPDSDADPLSSSEMSADSLTQMLRKSMMRESMSTARCRSMAQQRRSRKSPAPVHAHVQMGNALFGTHADTQPEHLTAREFRELCYELGLFIANDDIFLSVANQQRYMSRKQFVAWWRSEGAFLNAVYATKSRRRLFTQAVAYFQFYDVQRAGVLDGPSFKLLHLDLVGHSYANVHPDPAVCYCQLKQIRPADPIPKPWSCSFNEFVAWLLRIDALSEGDTTLHTSQTPSVTSVPAYGEV